MTTNVESIVSFPESGTVSNLAADAAGDLFGTTAGGGSANEGTVFEIPATGADAGEAVTLATFDGANGATPNTVLITDAAGDIFGSTSAGGTSNLGTVFEIPESGPNAGQIITLVNFSQENGASPLGGLSLDGAGDLFGVTSTDGEIGSGTVFEIPTATTIPGQLITLMSFSARTTNPLYGGIVSDAAGDLFGTTTIDLGNASQADNYAGAVLEIPATGGNAGNIVTLATFNGPLTESPRADLIEDSSGDLFGVAPYGGSSDQGTVFEVPKSGADAGQVVTLATFSGTDGAYPNGYLIADAAGDLFGTALLGGPNYSGSLFEIPKTSDGYGPIQTLLTFNTTGPFEPEVGPIGIAPGALFVVTDSIRTGWEWSDGASIFEITGTGASFAVPTISGIDSSQTTSSDAPVDPFAGVTIGDPNANGDDKLVITLSGAGGTLADANGLEGLTADGAGIYSLSGSASDITAELDALVFTPAASASGTASTTTFSLQAYSGAFLNTSGALTVTDFNACVAPTIAGTLADQPATSEAPVTPFSGVVISDANAGAVDTLTISSYGAEGTGTLADGVGFSGLTTIGVGVYTLTGSAAAITSELDALVFTPAAAAPRTSTATAFALNDVSSVGASVSDFNTSVINVNPAVAPSITGTVAGQITNMEAGIYPFFKAKLADPNGGATDTLTITLAGAGGTLADSPGFHGLTSTAPGVYTLTGTAAAITSELTNLMFTPTGGATSIASATTTFTLNDISSVGKSANDATTTVIDVSPLDTPSIFTTAGNPNAAPETPFATLAVTDPNDNGAAIDTLTIETSSSGELTDGNGFSGLTSGATAGTYTLSGTASAITAELDALIFTPVDDTVSTFTITDAYSVVTSGTITATVDALFGDERVSLLSPLASSGSDGWLPNDGLLSDAAGDLFGATLGGGNGGVVYEIAKPADGYSPAPIVLATFGGSLGYDLMGPLTTDANGDLFGTTSYGGANGEGAVFEIAKTSDGYAAKPTILLSIDSSNVIVPNGPMIADAEGNLFGTSTQGGAENFGTVFEIAKTANGYAAEPRILASFIWKNVASPTGALTFDAEGDLIGTASYYGFMSYDHIFEIARTATGYASTITDLTSGPSDFSDLNEIDDMIVDAAGDLFAISSSVGSPGSIVELVKTPNGYSTPIVLFTFPNISAAQSEDGLIADTSGDLFGTTFELTGAGFKSVAILGAQSGRGTTSETTLNPFSGVTIADVKVDATETLTITLGGAGGTLSDRTGFSGLMAGAAGVYTLSGLASAVTSELDALIFTPTAGARGTTSTTTFTLDDVSSSGASATDSTTSVVDTDPAVSPVISGCVAGQRTTDNVDDNPFSGVTLTDVNFDPTESVDIEISGAGGQLQDGSAFHGLQKIASGVYSLTGSASAVSDELESLIFSPNAETPETTSITNFTLIDNDSAGGSATNATTSVIDTTPAAPPEIVGKTALTTTSETPISPFAGLTLTDANAGATDTVTISQTGAGGALRGAGLSRMDGAYTLSGTASAVNADLQALVFTQAVGSARNATKTTTFTLTDKSSAGTTSQSATVTVADVAPVAPVITGAAARPTTGVSQSLKPFSAVVVSDANTGASVSARITLAGAGALSLAAGAGALTKVSTGVYKLAASTPSALTSALQALVFTPAASPTQAQQSVGFTLQVSDSFGQSASNAATSVTVYPGPKTSTYSATVALGNSLDLTAALVALETSVNTEKLSIVGLNATGALGEVTLNSGDLVYDAAGSGLAHVAANGSVTDSFQVTVKDPFGDTSTATVKVSVTNPATTISGAANGDATLYGTAGADVFVAQGQHNTIYVADGASGTIIGASGNAIVTAGSGDDTVLTYDSDVVVHLLGKDDLVGIGDGGDGNDTVSGSTGAARVTLGNGDDSLALGGTGNTIVLGNGDDTVVAGAGDENVTVGSGKDTITLAGQHNIVTLNGARATVSGDGGDETLTANGGDDTLTFSGAHDVAFLDDSLVADITDRGSSLKLEIGAGIEAQTIHGFDAHGAIETLTIHGFDTHGVIDLLNGVGGYANGAAAVAALKSDGHGGALLSLGSGGSIDFVNLAPNKLSAANFAVG